MSGPWMSVIVPAYNEEDGIVRLVQAVGERMRDLGRPYEIVVVDNASEDGTVQALEPLVEDHPLRVLRNNANRGKGFSVRRGMLEAKGQLRLLCDADCGPSLSSLPELLKAIEHADVVAGSRVASGAQVDRHQPLRRRIVGWPFIALTRLLMREPTRDVYCGFKLWRGSAAQAVFSRQRLTGWVFDAEVLALARGLGFRVTEVGVEWADRRGSKLSILQVLVPAVRELLDARRNVRAQLHAARNSSAGVAAAAADAQLVTEPAERGG